MIAVLSGQMMPTVHCSIAFLCRGGKMQPLQKGLDRGMSGIVRMANLDGDVFNLHVLARAGAEHLRHIKHL